MGFKSALHVYLYIMYKEMLDWRPGQTYCAIICKNTLFILTMNDRNDSIRLVLNTYPGWTFEPIKIWHLVLIHFWYFWLIHPKVYQIHFDTLEVYQIMIDDRKLYLNCMKCVSNGVKRYQILMYQNMWCQKCI